MTSRIKSHKLWNHCKPTFGSVYLIFSPHLTCPISLLAFWMSKSLLSFIFDLSVEDRACLSVKIDEILSTLIPVGKLGCRIRPHSCTLDRYPKIYVKSESGSRVVALSTCVFALNNLSLRDKMVNKEVSHLCGRSNCLVSSHLAGEEHIFNLQRKKCHRSRGSQRLRCCRHSPKCIL